MKNRYVTGIGCFAKPEKLRRILKKIVANYTLGQFEDVMMIVRHGAGKSEGIMLLKALLAGDTTCWPWSHAASQNNPRKKKITGFFLWFEDQQLNLSIFAKSTTTGQQRYTAKLEDLPRIRQKRLH
jgi:hypothetical protein